ncbi:MAG: hypothetical protein FVQ81_11075 [Candidatus Glassbacteria bacterium]|nr:hypothetical protein [Candidatus Glassbacteria bacterium]
MVSTLLENILVKTDTLIERVFRPPRDREPVDFGRYLNNPEKILLIADHDLAGVCLVSCFIPTLQQKFPAAKIAVVVNPEHASLLGGMKRVTVFPWENRAPHQLDSGFRRLSAELRQRQFHWGLNMAGGGRAEALLLYAGSVMIRTGIARDDNDRYYNLIVRSGESGGIFQRLTNLMRALKVDIPADGLELPFTLSRSERQRAQRFIRQRKSSSGNGRFIGFAPETGPAKSSMEQLLQRTCMRLVSEYEPLHLIVAGNLASADELKKNEQLRAYLFFFDDLRRMIAALAYCDRVITGSAGLAWLLGKMGVRVALIVTGRDRLAELGIETPDTVTVIREGDEGGVENLAVGFTR